MTLCSAVSSSHPAAGRLALQLYEGIPRGLFDRSCTCSRHAGGLDEWDVEDEQVEGERSEDRGVRGGWSMLRGTVKAPEVAGREYWRKESQRTSDPICIPRRRRSIFESKTLPTIVPLFHPIFCHGIVEEGLFDE